MFNRMQKQSPKPPCPTCRVIRRTLFLTLGLGMFAYYAFSPEQRNSDSVGALLEYVTIGNATIAIILGITSKLIFDAVKHLQRK